MERFKIFNQESSECLSDGRLAWAGDSLVGGLDDCAVFSHGEIDDEVVASTNKYTSGAASAENQPGNDVDPNHWE